MSSGIDTKTWGEIQAGMKFTAAFDAPEVTPLTTASGEPGHDGDGDDGGLPLTKALALLRLRQDAAFQDVLSELESQVDVYESKSKSLSTPAPTAQRFADRAEGIKFVLTAFANNFNDATERVKSATETERLALGPDDARVFAQVTGKQAVVSTANPGFPTEYDKVSAETVMENTKRAIDFFENDKMGKK
jgi:hypothetical protein